MPRFDFGGVDTPPDPHAAAREARDRVWDELDDVARALADHYGSGELAGILDVLARAEPLSGAAERLSQQIVNAHQYLAMPEPPPPPRRPIGEPAAGRLAIYTSSDATEPAAIVEQGQPYEIEPGPGGQVWVALMRTPPPWWPAAQAAEWKERRAAESSEHVPGDPVEPDLLPDGQR